MRDWARYFDEHRGTGVLATANREGTVNAAIFTRPVVVDEKTLAWVMAPRRSYTNLQENPQATFLFLEDGQGYGGVRLYLRKVTEERDPLVVGEFRQRNYPETYEKYKGQPLVVVSFELLEERPLVGDA